MQWDQSKATPCHLKNRARMPNPDLPDPRAKATPNP